MALERILARLSSVPWLALLEALATVAVAVAAILALRTWREQAKGNQRIQFLDQLTEAAYFYIYSIGPAVEFYRHVLLGINSFVETAESGSRVDGIRRYVEEHGQRNGKQFDRYLEASREAGTKLGLLLTKSMVLDLENRNDGEESVRDLLRVYEFLTAASTLVSMTNQYWENPKVGESYLKSFPEESSPLDDLVNTRFERLLEFVKLNLRSVYRAA